MCLTSKCVSGSMDRIHGVVLPKQPLMSPINMRTEHQPPAESQAMCKAQSLQHVVVVFTSGTCTRVFRLSLQSRQKHCSLRSSFSVTNYYIATTSVIKRVLFIVLQNKINLNDAVNFFWMPHIKYSYLRHITEIREISSISVTARDSSCVFQRLRAIGGRGCTGGVV